VAVNYVAGTTGFPRRKFFALDAFACVTWVAYSIGIGILASSFPWLHHNPLLSAGIAVVFAIVLGIVIDHGLRWWHKRLARHDVPSSTVQSSTAPSSTVQSTTAEDVPSSPAAALADGPISGEPVSAATP
jgi:membrane-associated protein